MIKFKYVFPAVLIAGSLLGAPLVMAQDAAPVQPPAPQTPMKHHDMKKMSESDMVEHHIAGLHDKLKVTAAQEDQWKPVAQVMRENAKTLSDLHVAKLANVNTQTAVEDLAAYREIAEAHYLGAKRMEEAFGTFYTSLSPEQKKVADDVFREHKHHMQQSQHGHGHHE